MLTGLLGRHVLMTDIIRQHDAGQERQKELEQECKWMFLILFDMI